MEATVTLNTIIEKALEQSMTAKAYADLLAEYALSGKTSGPNQSESMINYTKLNAQRSKRVSKTTVLDDVLVSEVKSIGEKQTWILITETWCGDAANSVPVIMKLAELNPKIDLRVVLRDSNPELIDQFLTNGGRSIPKLVALNESGEVIFDWGPRPETAQQLYYNWRDAKDKSPYEQFHIDIQQWYNTDKGQSIQKELHGLISKVA